ncbi:hypothetical protein ACQR16_04390 [Bradyrhizobium oligotrophicum]|uniref:hypothetical protein n=1 Tax=Bradyrhizobium oligotrophicum TaxID=44255 RepID=UPI003EC0108C
MNQVPQCVAAGYIDLDTGMLLSAKMLNSLPQEVVDLFSAATADLFQGSNVTTLEGSFRRLRGTKGGGDDHYFQEIVVFSDNMIHLFLRCKKHSNHVLAFVTRKNANIGMVIARSRMAVPSVEAAL